MGNLIAFGWYGGKYSHLGWLLPLLPETQHYCEPFGGSAAVLINREPSPVETYNDLDSEVVNFFRVLRDQKEALIEQIGLTPFSREEFEQAIDEPTEGLTEIERARRFYIRARQVRTGLAQKASTGRWAHCLLTSRAGMAGAVSRWLGAVEDLSLIAQRLLRVQIEHAPAIEVIQRYDSKETLFYCLVPGTLIRTQDERFILIEKIQVGDYIAPGRLVKETMTRHYQGRVLRFDVQGLPDPLEVTEDHRILRIPARQHKRQEKRRNDLLWQQREIVPASQVQVGDYLLVPLGGAEVEPDWHWSDQARKQGIRRDHLKFIICPELYRFLGYYLAEGHIQRQNGHAAGVILSFGTHETATWVQDAVACCERAFGLTPDVGKGPASTVTQVRVWSTTIAEFIEHCVSGMAKTKALRQVLLQAPAPLQREILVGWLRGDGGLSLGARSRIKLLGTTASETLARQMFLIALRCGLRPSFKRRAGKFYDVYFAAEDAMLLGWEVPCIRFRSSRRIIHEHMLVRVRQIRERGYDGPVYDLDVDGDNLFAAPYTLVHNCDPPYPHDSRGDNNAYAHEMTDKQHRELARILHSLKGKVALSSYNSKLMDELYHDWRCIKGPEKMVHSVKETRQEVLWVNYDLKELKIWQQQDTPKPQKKPRKTSSPAFFNAQLPI